jgi:hypothetical protein
MIIPWKTTLLALALASSPAMLNAAAEGHLFNNTDVTWYLTPTQTEPRNQNPIVTMTVLRESGRLTVEHHVDFSRSEQEAIEVGPGVHVYFMPLTPTYWDTMQAGQGGSGTHRTQGTFQVWTRPMSERSESKEPSGGVRFCPALLRVMAARQGGAGPAASSIALAPRIKKDLMEGLLPEGLQMEAVGATDKISTTLEFTFLEDPRQQPYLAESLGGPGDWRLTVREEPCCAIL